MGHGSAGEPLEEHSQTVRQRSEDRRLRTGEFEKLHELLSASGNPWAALAFELAIETSLRQGALFSVRSEWLDLENRVLRFPPNARGAENKGVPAVLPLSRRAVAVFRHLAAVAEGAEARVSRSRFGPADVTPEKLTGRVFGTSVNAVICICKRTLKKASADDLEVSTLRWHDLRHEAASRLFEKGLHPMEVASITGHRSMQMFKRYTHLRPEAIRHKLG
ncbi:site-specific integrase [Burkholderia vietnamiensis]|uniref:site-specific integrase n=1 Tax=Burkholderia vietnamiensis TaxID=60552 RepID=UPI001E575C55|nr:site-specific integrase [Burkholderia vietnamiensis]